MSKPDAKQQETVVVTGVSTGIRRAELETCGRTGLPRMSNSVPASFACRNLCGDSGNYSCGM
jgi:hypothetical protein